MRVVILGGPGSGKGTQLTALSQALQLPSISLGDILRDAIAQETFLGQQVKPYVESGQLIPDELIIQFMRLRLLQEDAAVGWILEGYPRNAFQAEELDFVLDDFHQSLDCAIYLDIPADLMMARSRALLRPDDEPTILQKRIAAFQDLTPPLLEYYGKRDRLLVVDATPTIAEVTQKILQNLKA